MEWPKQQASQIDSAEFSNEDYNIRSPARTKLLVQIKEVIGNVSVSPAFWACCHLADMNCLRDIANSPEQMILGYDEPLVFLSLRWTQRFRDSGLPGSEVASQRSEGPNKHKVNPDGQSWVQRSVEEANNRSPYCSIILRSDNAPCRERDDDKCVLTKQPLPEAAHIFPCRVLDSPAKGSRTSSMIPDFWKLLRLFWEKDRVNKWKETIFPSSQNPNTDIDKCFNLISLDASAHVKWANGLFALKPLELSGDQKQLTVQFFWQVPGNYDISSRIDLLTEPASSKGLENAGGHVLPRVVDGGPARFIRSGDMFTFTTKDPKNLPLPSMKLLEMQWFLQRLVGMCGGAGWPSLDLDDDENIDDGRGWLIPDHTSIVDNPLKRVCERVSAEEAAGITPEISNGDAMSF
ncbi:uncharacterized protein Z518_02829 [Rhinocladiella mackenziei CBS 650.93]|uniref:HNH nuclease domain-containing protein n=1 Tax=Rhinocladiella mackenziei CBS 650.93 TaxID=1442369 RepID=A0A0D2HCJ6_9EURO|nr:uncharacterized protein Z518_02829 [Rhinocladiella mackenziei CBS 650.93]KIX08173.1 hypothetical protein Z518_02829 [Rhinocladiella mackenziei CBS 650.93]